MIVSKRFRPYTFLGLVLCVCLLVVLSSSFSAPLQAAATPTILSQTSPETKPPNPPPEAPLSLTENVRKTILSNGLTVLTKEVKTVPAVSVQIWYRIGSRDEATGVNGIAHQLEHMLFKGTAKRPVQFGRLFSALGSDSNAFTSYDMTAYFGTVEANKLNTLLILEADRMQNSQINKAALESEKRVVISELQGYENDPSFRLSRAVLQAALPDSPYGLPVGGTKADVETFAVEQVTQYYRTYYRPDNATLILVGNFDTEEALQQVKAAFGDIPKPSTPLPERLPTAIAPKSNQTARQPIRLQEPGSAALLNVVYPLPNVPHPDVPALQVMKAVLTDGRSARLYQELVESGLASNIEAYAANLIGNGWYEITVTAAPGQELRAIEQTLGQTLAQVRNSGITSEELERAKAQILASTLLRNRSITSQAMQLGDDQVSTGDYQFTDRLMAAIRQVTPADVQRVARAYFTPQNQTVGYFQPTQVNGQAPSGDTGTTKVAESFGSSEPVNPEDVAKYLPPIPNSARQPNQPLPETLTLANGLKVLLLPDRSTPTVTLAGFVNAGSVFDKTQTAGLASLTAENVMNGTQNRTALELATVLEDRGASLDFAASREGVTIAGNALAADLPTVVEVLADVLQQASFPGDRLEITRQQALSDLEVALDTPNQLARRVFQQAVYPANHPFYALATEDSLKRITREDVIQFYNTHYQPETTTLMLMGDFNPATVRNLINQQFGRWEGHTAAPSLKLPSVTLPQGIKRLNPLLPSKTQSVTYLGYSAIARTDPRYYSAQVLNQILGGDTLSSRLGTEIRDRQGLTYGIYSIFQAGKYPGPFLISMQTDPQDVPRAIAGTLSLLQQIRQQGVTDQEVETAKRSLISNYVVELANPDALAYTTLLNSVYGLPLNEIRQYPSQINAVTPAQVNAAIQELLHPDRIVVVTAGPAVPTPAVKEK